VGTELRGRDDGGNVNNMQYKSNQNCHSKSPRHNEYVLIKNYNNNNKTKLKTNKTVKKNLKCSMANP
jgi:hypothetical protein